MKAAQYVAPGYVAIVETPMTVHTPDQLLIRVEYVGVCGSDLSLLYGTPREYFPFPPGHSGHECVGVVVDPAHSALDAGTRVLVLPPESNALAEYLAVAPQHVVPLP